MFDKLLGKKTDRADENLLKPQNKLLFGVWLDGVLENCAFDGVIAVNFNLYQGECKEYHVEMIGSDDEYDPNDGDWACSEAFTTRDNLYVSDESVGRTWEEALQYFKVAI